MGICLNALCTGIQRHSLHDVVSASEPSMDPPPNSEATSLVRLHVPSCLAFTLPWLLVNMLFRLLCSKRNPWLSAKNPCTKLFYISETGCKLHVERVTKRYKPVGCRLVQLSLCKNHTVSFVSRCSRNSRNPNSIKQVNP